MFATDFRLSRNLMVHATVVVAPDTMEVPVRTLKRPLKVCYVQARRPRLKLFENVWVF